MPVSDWADLFTQTITLEEASSENEYGGRNYGSPASYSARVVAQNKYIRRPNGVEFLSTTKVWIQGTPTVSLDDRITLPDSTTPQILLVRQYPDELGDHHTELDLG